MHLVRNGFTLDAASGTDCINNDGDDFWACCWRSLVEEKVVVDFFKDGEEFASAAAMNMSAGALNNYVQTSVWSDNLSGAVAGDPYQLKCLMVNSILNVTIMLLIAA